MAGQQPQAASTPVASEPITELAKQGSMQLSLETPQNKAGGSSAVRKKSAWYIDRGCGVRIRAFNAGQGIQLGTSGIYVAHDFWCVGNIFWHIAWAHI